MSRRITSSFAGVAWLCVALAGAQQPAAQAAHTGCVTRTEAGDTVLAQKDACSVLAGKAVPANALGHLATIEGSVRDATATTPRTIVVSGVRSVGESCSETCSPHPPGHRGLGHEKPGSEGGTPGMTSTPRPQ